MSYPGYNPNPNGYPPSPMAYPPSGQHQAGYPPSMGFGSPPQLAQGPTPYPSAAPLPFAAGPPQMNVGQPFVNHPMSQGNPGYGPVPSGPPAGFYDPQMHQNQHMPVPMTMPTPEYHQSQMGYQPPYPHAYPGAPAYPHTQQQPSHHSSHAHIPANPVVATVAASSVKKHEDDKEKKPTVKPVSDFSASVDCERLKKAMKGFGTDEKTITSILCARSNTQRVIIAATYKSLYGKDLIKELKGELSGSYEDLVIALMTPLPEYMASELHKAIKGAGTEEYTLIQILCSSNNLEMKDIKEAYQKLYNKSLESAVVNDTSGDLKRLLVAIIQGSRSENRTPNMEQARADAEQLYKAGEGTWGTSESTFFSIFANRSYAELRKIDECYIQKTGHSLEKAIKKEFSGYVKKGLKAILSLSHNKPAYFADVIKMTTKGLGTKEKVLIRVIATRCEIDLGLIKEQYKIKHGKNLEDVISNETSGDFKKLLLALCGRH